MKTAAKVALVTVTVLAVGGLGIAAASASPKATGEPEPGPVTPPRVSVAVRQGMAADGTPAPVLALVRVPPGVDAELVGDGDRLEVSGDATFDVLVSLSGGMAALPADGASSVAIVAGEIGKTPDFVGRFQRGATPAALRFVGRFTDDAGVVRQRLLTITLAGPRVPTPTPDPGGPLPGPGPAPTPDGSSGGGSGTTPDGSSGPTPDGGPPSPTPDPLPPPPGPPMPYEAATHGNVVADLTGVPGGVRWRVYPGSLLTPAPGQTLLQIVQAADQALLDTSTLGAGVEATDPEARAIAEQFLDNLPPVSPAGGVGVGNVLPPVQFHEGPGIKLSQSCTQLSVDDLVTWVAWASPWLASRGQQEPDPRALVHGLLSVAFIDTGCPIDIDALHVGPRPLRELIAEADEIAFATLRAGGPWPAQGSEDPTPLERAAARLVGRTIGPHQAPAYAYRGYAVYVTSQPVGYRWVAYRRGRTPGRSPDLDGNQLTSPAAVSAAKIAINNALA